MSKIIFELKRNIQDRICVHGFMIKNKGIWDIKEESKILVWDINELIDLFVEMNFNDIYNETLLFQFKLLASRIGYPKDMIERVVKLGYSEYEKLMEEIYLSSKKLVSQ